VGRASEGFCETGKEGVAAIAARNPHVIDVEMGLPADEVSNAGTNDEMGPKVAPRIDIVAIEESASEGAQVAFYEAKLFSNNELRSDDLRPKILEQLAKYARYMAPSDGEGGKRCNQIIKAYRNTCIFMQQVAQMRGHMPDPLVDAVAKGLPLALDPYPRVLIYEYEANEVAEGSPWARHHNVLSKGLQVFMRPKAKDIILSRRDPRLPS
jgi:hypothetical protein